MKRGEEGLRIEVGEDAFTLGAKIGEGGFGTVYQALWEATGEFVAVKRVRLKECSETDQANIQREITLLSKLAHEHIVRYITNHVAGNVLSIVMECVGKGSLATVLRDFGGLHERLAAGYTSQVLEGLDFLHSQGVVHRDIKAANILVTYSGVVKIGDFGIAAQLGDTFLVDGGGSFYWIAPEVIDLQPARVSSDIWSVGATVIELLTGKPPYADLKPFEAMFQIAMDDHPPLPDGISPLCADFLLAVFRKEPTQRPSAASLMRHKWIAENRAKLLRARQKLALSSIGDVMDDVQREEKEKADALLKTREAAPTSFARAMRTGAPPAPAPAPAPKRVPAPQKAQYIDKEAGSMDDDFVIDDDFTLKQTVKPAPKLPQDIPHISSAIMSTPPMRPRTNSTPTVGSPMRTFSWTPTHRVDSGSKSMNFGNEFRLHPRQSCDGNRSGSRSRSSSRVEKDSIRPVPLSRRGDDEISILSSGAASPVLDPTTLPISTLDKMDEGDMSDSFMPEDLGTSLIQRMSLGSSKQVPEAEDDFGSDWSFSSEDTDDDAVQLAHVQQEELESAIRECYAKLEGYTGFDTPENASIVESLKRLSDVVMNTYIDIRESCFGHLGLSNITDFIMSLDPKSESEMLFWSLYLIDEIVVNSTYLQNAFAGTGILAFLNKCFNSHQPINVLTEIVSFLYSFIINVENNAYEPQPVFYVLASHAQYGLVYALGRGNQGKWEDTHNFTSMLLETISGIVLCQAGRSSSEVAMSFIRCGLLDTLLGTIEHYLGSSEDIVLKSSALLSTLLPMVQPKAIVKTFCTDNKLSRIWNLMRLGLSKVRLEMLKIAKILVEDNSAHATLIRNGIIDIMMELLMLSDRKVHYYVIVILQLLCKVNTACQQEVVRKGIIPHLISIFSERDSTFTSFQFLCDLVRRTRVGTPEKEIIWDADVLSFLLSPKVIEQTVPAPLAFETIACWLQDEHKRVKAVFEKTHASERIAAGFYNALKVHPTLPHIIGSVTSLVNTCTTVAFGMSCNKLFVDSVVKALTKREATPEEMKNLLHVITRMMDAQTVETKAQFVTRNNLVRILTDVKKKTNMHLVVSMVDTLLESIQS